MSQTYDRRILRTKKLLREALTELLQEKPLEKITVTELCALSEVNRSTFYLHYRDIHDMYEQIEEEVYLTFAKKLDRFIREEGRWYENLEGGGMPTLSIFLEAYHFLKANRDIVGFVLKGEGSRNIVMRIYQQGKERFLQDLDQKISEEALSKFSYYYEYIASGCVGIITSWVEGGMKESPEQMNALTQEFILRTPLPRTNASDERYP